MINLSTDIKYLQGVGPLRAELLEKELAIKTYGDLLACYPYKYVDRTKIYRISEIDGNMPYVQICGRILSIEDIGEGRGKRMVAHFGDGTGIVDLVWFQGIKFATNAYKVGKTYIAFGKPTVFNGRINIAHPELEEIAPADAQRLISALPRQGSLFEDEDEDSLPNTSEQSLEEVRQTSSATQQRGGIQCSLRPYYHTSEKMKKNFLNSQTLAKLTANLLRLIDTPLSETLPEYLVQGYRMMSYDEAVRNIHYPQSAELLRRAQSRLKFEELFYVQLNILRYARNRQLKVNGIKFTRVGENFNTFFHNHLPFELTGAQKRVIREIHADMQSGRQMNRLLQGDVGSGKTLVALMCSLIALDNGCQACIMAPTEILAEQHVETIRNFLGDMPIRVELLTGSIKGKRREALLADLVCGKINILVGTHAVIEDNVKFDRLGFVVIDEQHRFGVAQRARLWQKNEIAPHVLVMTATPIPRTLAMTLYGDLDVSVIDELPPGRKPIKTIHQFDVHRERIYDMMRHELSLGRQIYIVYPLIKVNEKNTQTQRYDADYYFESRDGANILTPTQRRSQEKLDMKNLEQGFEEISAAFPHHRVSKVHGKMKPAEKDAEMQAFASHQTHILVSTTVIEVGVNVPNASVMIIENAERFGLSQLHQLRGRVGRGADQSYCVLVTNFKISNDTRKRIQIMVDSTDGFEIAEQDLKLRGPGDLEGTAQSGMAFDLKIANIARDGQILQYARNAAQSVIDNDPDESNPQNAILWQRLRQLRKTDINWGAIS